MNLIILGIDHEMQGSNPELADVMVQLVKLEQVVLIAEENAYNLPTMARQIAEAQGLAWLQIDMNMTERLRVGIYEKLCNRMQLRGYGPDGLPLLAIRYAPREDGMREEFWLDRLETQGKDGTVMVVCGCLHAGPDLCSRRRKGAAITSASCSTPLISRGSKPNCFEPLGNNRIQRLGKSYSFTAAVAIAGSDTQTELVILF